MNGKTSLLNGKIYLFDGKTSLLNGKISLFNGKTHLLNGEISLLNCKIPLFNGKTHLLNGKIPLLNGKTSLLNGKTHLLNREKHFVQTPFPFALCGTLARVEEYLKNTYKVLKTLQEKLHQYYNGVDYLFPARSFLTL